MHTFTTTTNLAALALIIAGMALIIMPAPLRAEDNIPTMERVTVVGQAEEPNPGSSKLHSEVLHTLPQKSKSVAETATILPRVQIGESQRTSENAGEILPPLISISGGRAYENSFIVDGINQSSILDPLTGNNVAESIRDVPSHPQRGFLFQSLVEKITVFDSNIPARYGGFVGGVLEAETRLPRHELGGQISLRGTRDAWTSFHIDPGREDDFRLSTDQYIHSRFKKYDAGFELDIPINDDMGLLAAYEILRSDLESFNINRWEEKSKTLENYLLKYVWAPNSPYTIELMATYTPSNEEFFIERTKNSNIDITRSGYVLSGKVTGDLDIGNIETGLAYLTNDNSRRAPTHHYYWPKNTPSKNWGDLYDLPYSAEGGYGDIDNQEASIQGYFNLLTRPVPLGETTSTFNLGFELNHDQGNFKRHNTTYEHALNRANVDSSVQCAEGDPSCIDNEVYFRERRAYQPEQQNETINSYAIYLDDSLEAGPLSIRPGLRLSSDDFMKNTNLDYRLAGSWDLFQDKRTHLTGGYNRYYGSPLLAFKLREGRQPYQKQTREKQSDNTLTDWAPSTDGTLLVYNYSELDTPYSDEWNIGVTQQIFDGTLELNYLERSNKDQYAQELFVATVDGNTIRGWNLNNNGSSEYKSVKVSWERQWQDHFLNVNYTYSDQVSSNESYFDIFDDDDNAEDVWFDGKVINKFDLPRSDFNREHMLNIIYVGRLPWNLTFSNTTRYLGEYETLDKLSNKEKDLIVPEEQKALTAYQKVERPDYWIFDWRLDWEKQLNKNQLFVLTLEINNVFDRTPPSGDSDDIYELGRQFWLGMTYKF